MKNKRDDLKKKFVDQAVVLSPYNFLTYNILPQFGHVCSRSLHPVIKNGMKQNGGRHIRSKTSNQVSKPAVCLTLDITGFRHCGQTVGTGLSRYIGIPTDTIPSLVITGGMGIIVAIDIFIDNCNECALL